MNKYIEELQVLLVAGLHILGHTDKTMETVLTILQTEDELNDILDWLASFDEGQAMELTDEQIIAKVFEVHKYQMLKESN